MYDDITTHRNNLARTEHSLEISISNQLTMLRYRY